MHVSPACVKYAHAGVSEIHIPPPHVSRGYFSRLAFVRWRHCLISILRIVAIYSVVYGLTAHSCSVARHQ
jgi:hypothetical protein